MTATLQTPPSGVDDASLPSRRHPQASEARWKRLAFGDQPAWVRPSAFGMLVLTAVLYLYNLTSSTYGNTFYAAAVQAGTKSWTALLFGSLDSGNAITVDKPPASLWIPALLGRVFGFSSATVLVPEALMGVAAVGLLYLAVKRSSGPAAGLIAALGLALTPVATLMFRFNNPDAMLTLCLVAAGYATIRAMEKAGWQWLALAGAVTGLAFLTKMLQGFLTIPAMALAYLLTAPVPFRKRLAHLGAAAAGIVVVAGSYIAAFEFTPASDRPYMAGSNSNSFWELTFGYNGLGRITGSEGGGPGGGAMGGGPMGGAGGFGGGNTSFGGPAGLLRMFGAAFGSEVSWLLPAALLLLVAGLWFTRREARTSRTRGALIVWGGWLLVTAAIFSFMSGIIHPYYVVALAPAVAALVGIGTVELWRGRGYLPARIVLAVTVLATSVWSAVLLGRDASWLPWLKVLIIVLGALAAVAIFFGVDRIKRLTAVVVIAAVPAMGLGSASWAVATASVAHNGSIPTSGPSGSGMGMGGFAGRAIDRADGTQGTAADGGQGAAVDRASGGPTMGGPGGGTASTELTALLKGTNTKWSAIISGATSAADLELASNTAVISLGGWNGSDPYPTLDQFKAMVAAGDIGYYISGGGMGGRGGGMGGNGTGSAIASWVQANFTATTVGNTTVYKLTK